WTGTPLAARLREALGVPVFVDNDISAVTAAERLYGPGADDADFLLVAIGQGIGLGMVLDGAPYRGAAGSAGELGHLPILQHGLAMHLLPAGRDTRIDVRAWDEELIAASAARIVLGAPLAAPRQKG